jgi:hypothetical protein
MQLMDFRSPSIYVYISLLYTSRDLVVVVQVLLSIPDPSLLSRLLATAPAYPPAAVPGLQLYHLRYSVLLISLPSELDVPLRSVASQHRLRCNVFQHVSAVKHAANNIRVSFDLLFGLPLLAFNASCILLLSSWIFRLRRI